jgi:tetratricopeptide (TPR) repeat protein
VGNFHHATACVASLLDRSDLEASRRDDIRRKVEEVSFVQRKADAAVGVLMSHRAGELSVSQLTELLSELERVLKEASMSSALLAWKAEILLRLGNLEEAALVAGATQSDEEAEAGNSHSVWKWWVQAQVAWHKAEMETALRLLGAGLEQLSTREAEMATSSACHFQLPSASALSEAKENMKSLLVLKNSGNTAFMASKLAEAKEAYSKGLAANEMCSPAIAAVLHSNRAAVLHKEGSLLSALADCCRARALNPRYHKSYSRLAAILVDLHRPAEAVRVLEAMVVRC